MITLYKFGPFLGTPDSSPFVIKVMMLLKMAGVPYREAQGNPFKAPQKLLPFIEDDGVKVADSTLIRFHLEKKRRIDFDGGLSAEQKAVAWAVERMCEDHLYFAMLDMRWLDAANFKNGLGRHMFGPIPAPARPLVKSMLRRMNAKRLHGHGIGRHPRQQIAELAIRDVDALAAIIGDKPFLIGDKPCAADGFVFGIITSILTPPLDSPIRAAMQKHANLVAYRDRVTSTYFADHQPVARAVDSPASGARRLAHG
ncbi:MAG TPA: glutathione S-transferase family protein [Stellaceae bacterium]|nr:glutathione S-transferase family protein [Stellaceae bacterium]